MLCPVVGNQYNREMSQPPHSCPLGLQAWLLLSGMQGTVEPLGWGRTYQAETGEYINRPHKSIHSHYGHTNI